MYVEPEQFLKALNDNKIDIAFLVFLGPYNNCQFETNVATDRQYFLSAGLIFARIYWSKSGIGFALFSPLNNPGGRS